ncbi:putative tRNA isopentenyltransferase [Podospora australis]|uniref:tRNA dimethylallyltransferase n=1 Tax=Podospora australis TaxID=1536484 RepID=A0AAN6X391_9PEZI|nr:putative tRNA isopentenyltransferase [Podospora australis]
MFLNFLSRFTRIVSSQTPPKRPVIIRKMKPLIIIYGSTGTGKSDLAVELATRFNGEVVNADAMQMYKGLPVITNKLTVDEQRGIPHHLLGNVDLSEDPWVVTRFKQEATRIISEIRGRGKLPIVVGGTSYYLDGMLFDDRLVDDQEKPSDTWVSNREELAEKYPILTESGEAMMKKLREVDPVMAEKWHLNDVRKIRNSLEIYFATGRRASDIYAEQRSRKESKWASSGPAQDPSLGETLLFWLYAEREALNERLDKRVDKMVNNGLLSEAAEVYDYLQERLASGEVVNRTKGIWQSIGFRQFEPYLQALKETPDSPGLAKLKEAGIEDTKTATRQYAKYQVRWVTYKTVLALQEEKLLDKFYLLDSSSIQAWNEEVLAKGVDLAEKFLAEIPLPRPVDVSETARQVLTEAVEKISKEAQPCRKTCDACKKTLLTEELWQKHITSRKHHKVVQAIRRRALVPAGRSPSKALIPMDKAPSESPNTAEANKDESPSLEQDQPS